MVPQSAPRIKRKLTGQEFLSNLQAAMPNLKLASSFLRNIKDHASGPEVVYDRDTLGTVQTVLRLFIEEYETTSENLVRREL